MFDRRKIEAESVKEKASKERRRIKYVKQAQEDRRCSIVEAMRSYRVIGVSLALVALLAGSAHAQAPTVAGARRFLAHAESTLDDLNVRAGRAAWVANTYITFDTQELAAEADEANAVATRDFAMEARRYERLRLPPDLRRKLLVLKLSLAAPPPPNPREASELSKITSSMQADYGRGRYCKTPDNCLEITEIERILATSRDPAELLDAWQGWHRIAVGMRDRYARFVTPANAGAKGLGFAEVGEAEAFRARVREGDESRVAVAHAD